MFKISCVFFTVLAHYLWALGMGIRSASGLAGQSIDWPTTLEMVGLLPKENGKDPVVILDHAVLRKIQCIYFSSLSIDMELYFHSGRGVEE